MVARLPMFREAYARRRGILPVDGFFEWKAIKGLKAKQPFAIAMRDGSPLGIAGIWENWKDPASVLADFRALGLSYRLAAGVTR
jgi:putative SOS response-associated peptidase YedK